MTTTVHQPAGRHVGQFQIESLGMRWPEDFQGYGLEPQSEYNYCTYGIGNTEKRAFLDCLKMVAYEGFDVDDETESRIREAYGPADNTETALEAIGVEQETDETPFFYIGIKWNCREETAPAALE